MQSNIYTAKIHKQRQKDAQSNKLDTSEKGIKQDYKGKSWKRGTDKRSLDFNGLQGA